MSKINKVKEILNKWCRISFINHYLKTIAYLVFKNKYPYKWGEINEIQTEFKSNQKKIVYICDGLKNHGGLSDRFKGLLTTFSEAKRLKLPFYIYWTSPFQLSDFLIPASKIDWRINSKHIHYNYKYSFPFILDISPVHYKNVIKKYLFRYCLKDKRDILVYSNLMHEKKNISALFHELFKPSDYLKENIDKYLNDIGTSYYSYTFRFGNLLGDFTDIVGHPLINKDKNELIEHNLEELKQLLENLPETHKALITSDSFYFLQKVKKLDRRICLVEKELMHIDFYDNNKATKEIWLKSFLDFFLIMRADKIFQLRTGEMYNSSFPSFAATIGRKEYVLHEF